jgi:AraC-like DNA-binding protein
VDEIQSIQPTEALRPYVRAYAQRRLHLTREPLIEPCPARLEQVLEFELGDPFEVEFAGRPSMMTPKVAVIGANTQMNATVRLLHRVESFAIFFQPAGFTQLFGIPMRDLTNRAFDATSVCNASLRGWWNKLGEVSSFSERVALAERHLLLRARDADAPSLGAICATRFLAAPATGRIAVHARLHRLSVRQFERRFSIEVGATPGSFARVARFQTALDAKVANTARSWLDIAHSVGYFDQMHMIHDFKNLAGDTPNRLLERLGDMRPEALAVAE